jgi:hypothetical protein
MRASSLLFILFGLMLVWLGATGRIGQMLAAIFAPKYVEPKTNEEHVMYKGDSAEPTAAKPTPTTSSPIQESGGPDSALNYLPVTTL